MHLLVSKAANVAMLVCFIETMLLTFSVRYIIVLLSLLGSCHKFTLGQQRMKWEWKRAGHPSCPNPAVLLNATLYSYYYYMQELKQRLPAAGICFNLELAIEENDYTPQSLTNIINRLLSAENEGVNIVITCLDLPVSFSLIIEW